MAAMCGWLKEASTRASRSNRASAWASFTSSERSNFKATGRPSLLSVLL